ncbi:MAG: hypothetical protein KY395_08825 [Actinobacteria bacterium]|nr:hypothetical protein [Actinomycetota bacterium]
MTIQRQRLLAIAAATCGLASFISLLLGWAGLRDEPVVAAQMPYAVTGGGACLAFAIAAAVLASMVHREIQVRTLREDIAVLQDEIEELTDRLGGQIDHVADDTGAIALQEEPVATSRRRRRRPVSADRDLVGATS